MNQTEYEMLTQFGIVEVLTERSGQFNVLFRFPSEYTLEDLMDSFDKAIEYQESDSGDWIRAAEWRAGKSELLTKLRRAYLFLLRDLL